MGDKIGGPPPEGTPPVDFKAASPEFMAAALGPQPFTSASSYDLCAHHPERWPSDKTGLEFLHRGMIHRLWKLGWSLHAAAELRRRLEDGEVRAVLIDDDDGREHPIPPEHWRGRDASARMFWEGRGRNGYVYLTTAQEPARTKAADLGTRERTTAHKMLLAAVEDAYGAKRGKRSDAAKLIAAKSEQLWPGNGVSERTVRAWLKAAADDLGDPTSEA
jgi:hypothetical protein